jgi:hypothetical protein
MQEVLRQETSRRQFSHLERSFQHIDVALRPNSRQMNHVSRHGHPNAVDLDELNFNYALDSNTYPLGGLHSLQEVFDAVQHEQHLVHGNNFSDHTLIECLHINGSDGGSLVEMFPVHRTDSADLFEDGVV